MTISFTNQETMEKGAELSSVIPKRTFIPKPTNGSFRTVGLENRLSDVYISKKHSLLPIKKPVVLPKNVSGNNINNVPVALQPSYNWKYVLHKLYQPNLELTECVNKIDNISEWKLSNKNVSCNFKQGVLETIFSVTPVNDKEHIANGLSLLLMKNPRKTSYYNIATSSDFAGIFGMEYPNRTAIQSEKFDLPLWQQIGAQTVLAGEINKISNCPFRKNEPMVSYLSQMQHLTSWIVAKCCFFMFNSVDSNLPMLTAQASLIGLVAEFLASKNKENVYKIVKSFRNLDINNAQNNYKQFIGIDKAKNVLSKLFLLKNPEGEIFHPTKYAYNVALRLLGYAYNAFGKQIPECFVTSDGEAGIIIDWRLNNKLLRLDIPSSEKNKIYIYHKQGKNSDIVYNITEVTLIKWLDWLIKNG